MNLLLAISTLIATAFFFYTYLPAGMKTQNKESHVKEKVIPPNTRPIKIVWQETNQTEEETKDTTTRLRIPSTLTEKKETTLHTKDTTPTPSTTSSTNTALEDAQKALHALLKKSKIRFLFNKFELTKESKKLLRRVAKLIQKYPDFHYTIQGHTDNTGEEAYNLFLSKERAKTVRQYLIYRGVTPKQCSSTGFGSSKPIATNETPIGRYTNRRVVIDITPQAPLKESF